MQESLTQSMTGFSMPRVAIAATLRMTAGEAREGEVFVSERAAEHAGHETPLDMLNRPDAFFPFRPKADAATVLLVTKARTVTLTVARSLQDEDPTRLSVAKRSRLSLTLADGSRITGWATLELPQHHSRLLDYLNTSSGPFFAVATESETHLVNRAHVLYVHPED